MAKFLEQVAEYILEDASNDLLYTAIIFPNKRSEIFLKNHLRKRIKKTFWLPDFFTIDEFIVSNSGLTELEPIRLYFELFKIHKLIAGKDARTLDDFLAWAPVMLSDFNDIDLYLADAGKIFTHLSEIRAIEEWNPGKALTDLQKNYLSFYNSLGQYYTKLNDNLSKRGYGYKGMIYRNTLQNTENLSGEWKWNRFILVGFNALSLAEKNIFTYLHKHFKVETLFDVDDYYLSDKSSPINEAGKQINELISAWKIDDVKWLGNSLKTDQKKIKVLGIPKRIGQVKYASQTLENWANEAKINDGSSEDPFLDTAVVLADEQLLVPFLHSLPQIVNRNDEKIPFNITMGYPLKNCSILEFIKSWLSFLESSISSNSIPVKNILELFNNAFFRSCADYFSNNETQTLIKVILEKNNTYQSKQQLLELAGSENTNMYELINLLFSKPKKPSEFIDLLIEFMIKCKPSIDISVKESPILREQFILIISLLKKLKVLLDDVKPSLTYRAIEKIIVQLMSRSEINLKGEPLTGIQVMGMLETRTLDFENLIILSANDGILPKTESIESFIPFDIRRNYHLPLPKDKTDVYSYHFFRLLQRAKKVDLIYNSEPDALGGGEKSRFILQLEEELSRVNTSLRISNQQIQIPVDDKTIESEISVNKTAEIADLINIRFAKGLSPTSLTTYISCPLQFYFKYLLSLKTPEILESNIEANVLGNVIHGVLEDLYDKYINKSIDTKTLGLTEDQVKIAVLNKFKEEFEGGDLSSGQNLLIVEVANQYIKNYLKAEQIDLSKNERMLLSTEEELETQISLNGKTLKLRGIIDRTDKAIGTNTIRIIDYKTGRVDKNDLIIKEWEDLTDDTKKSKAFQLLFYSYLYNRRVEAANNLEAGIISMRNISNGFMKLILPDGLSTLESLPLFENMVLSLASQISDLNQAFVQTEDEKRCKYCDYKNICNRNPNSDF